MGWINNIGLWYEKLIDGLRIGRLGHLLTLKGNVEVQGGQDVFEHTFQAKHGIVAHLDDILETLWELTSLYNLRVPTSTEWEDERLTWGSNNTAGAFASPLKLSRTGSRSATSGNILDSGFGNYWSDTISGTNSLQLFFNASNAAVSAASRGAGYSIRLIVNGTFTLSEFQTNYENKTILLDGSIYGYCYNSTTQKIWLDRNLGAIQVATSSTDVDSYGDLYQWGRRTDGHQLRISTTTSTLSSIDQPEHGDFIVPGGAAPNDWRNPQNNNLWQGVDGINIPVYVAKLIGKEGEKADYYDLLNIPAPPTLQAVIDESNSLGYAKSSGVGVIIDDGVIPDFRTTIEAWGVVRAERIGEYYTELASNYIYYTDGDKVFNLFFPSGSGSTNLTFPEETGTLATREWVEPQLHILKTKVTITPAQMLDLLANPITLVSAPGVGKVINVLGYSDYLDFNTVAYDAGGNLWLRMGSEYLFSINVDDAFSRYIARNPSRNAIPIVFTVLDNTAVTLQADVNATQGDSPVTIIVTYTIDDFN